MFSTTLSKAIAVATLATVGLLAGCASGPPRSDEQFARIQRGMTTHDVQRLFGPPDETMNFPLSHTQAWDYGYQDSWGYMAVFSVTFDAGGQALSTFSTRINAGGDYGGRHHFIGLRQASDSRPRDQQHR